jgi:hypothetical protein
MEVTITIRESIGATSITQAEAAQPEAQPSAQPPTEVLLQAARTGAIDAGPAPALSPSGQPGVPPPFVSKGTAQVSPGVASSADESAGAAPGSEARIATYTIPESRGGV